MKCKHCSARIDRAAWFCPNCKRSASHSPQRSLGRVWLPVSLGLVGVLSVGILASRWLRPPAAPEAEVDVREVAIVEITPREQPEEREAPPKPAVEKRDRAEEPRSAKRENPPSPEPEPEPEPAPTPAPPSGRGAISVSIDQPVRTFVYLNGGTLLGEAPLKNAAVPAGRHTLVFWSPSVGGRSTRTVHVSPGERVEVVERVQARESFNDDASSETETPG